MLARASLAAVCRQDDELATSTTPCVRSRRDVEMIVIVTGKATSRLSCSREARDGLVHVAVGVEAAAPQVLAVGWVGTAAVGLLAAVVDNGDTAGENHIGEGVFEQ